ncbi:MAG: class I SAM-dependent methyltransferase [Planctomycetales bacterium]|nr:class I SAM-dependent methyltransferase [Planctomycetales bacterium]
MPPVDPPDAPRPLSPCPVPQSRLPHRPAWRLPQGVSRASWDYFRSASIADDYDAYFAWNSLFEFDQRILDENFAPHGRVADLGCGTGRALLPLVRSGRRGLAIDLSPHMLRIVRDKAVAEDLPIACLQANLVELDAVADHAVDDAMCLFSTLGMIQGRANRRRALEHVRRIVRPGGCFVLHVHNFWFNLRDPGGPWWVATNLLSAPFRKGVEIGDKWFPYRGLPKMFLHVFRWRELASDLEEAGWRIERRIRLDVERRHALRHPWWLPALRTNGWIVICR